MEPDIAAGPQTEKKIRWALIIAIFFIVGLAIDHFFLHIIFEERMKENKLEIQTDAGKPGGQFLRITSPDVSSQVKSKDFEPRAL